MQRGRWPAATAQNAFKLALERDFPSIPSTQLLEDALLIAVTFNRTVYDSIYVAAALLSKSTLVTADEKLANALASHFPVKWLGAFF